MEKTKPQDIVEQKQVEEIDGDCDREIELRVIQNTLNLNKPTNTRNSDFEDISEESSSLEESSLSPH